jgi:hypothetical protein
MIQNFGSKPQMICKIVIETVIIIGFLYLMINSFKVIFFYLTTATTWAARILS